MAFDQLEVKLCSIWGGDRNIAEAAWASTFNPDTVEKKTDSEVMRVVTGVVHKHHDTPKESTWTEWFFTFPIFIERQFDKYRMTVQYQQFLIEFFEAPMGRDHITQNELSGRYRTIPDRPYKLPKDVVEIIDRHPYTLLNNSMADAWQTALSNQHDLYQHMLKQLRTNEENKIITNDEYRRAREVLRGLLGTAYLTDMRIKMNMNAFEHIICQRLDAAAQMESRVVAYRMIEAMLDVPEVQTLVTEYIQANGWGPLMNDVRKELEND